MGENHRRGPGSSRRGGGETLTATLRAGSCFRFPDSGGILPPAHISVWKRDSVENKLTKADVQRLLDEPSPEGRAEAAAKVAGQFERGELTPSERKLAEDIFRLMLRDAEVRVREALASHLKESPDVPHDVALALARDVDTVAVPMLSSSVVLTDDDLIAIVRSQNVAKQIAVAGRHEVSAPVAEAVVAAGNEKAVVRLVSNEGAEIPEQSLQKVIDDFGTRQDVQGALVRRSSLPITVTERLVTVVSENLRRHLLTTHELPRGLAADLVLQARERAILGLSSGSDEADLERLVRQLHDHGRLTASIILRAVCMGDLPFFETALSTLVNVPLVNARILVHDAGRMGFKAIYEKSGLPPTFYAAMRAAIDVAGEMQYDGEAGDRERYIRRMMERILTQYGDLGVSFEGEDLEYLLSKLNQLPPTVHA
ncbi:MAG: DUF2336 domain-containing protein [Alphaproteobacteria bacterium]|nr:DUF2336 domain-containing protein [Alphaproteobacteria bacterium]